MFSAVVPTLPEAAEECEVKVATQYAKSGVLLKVPRTYTYGKALKVVG